MGLLNFLTLLIFIFSVHSKTQESFHKILQSANKSDKTQEPIHKILQSVNKSDIPSINPNKLVDQTVDYFDDLLVHNGMDPVELPDIKRNFSYKPFLINYHGEYALTEGWLHDMSTMKRDGDVNLWYNFGTEQYEAFIPVAFQDLQFNYSYKVKFMNIGPVGIVMGKISDVKIKLYLSYSNSTHIKLHDFDITDTGHISVRFVGNGLTDWLVNILSETSSYVLHPIILRIIQATIRPNLEQVIDYFNEML
ncbi:mite allergen Der f 7-like [Aethina tumida]|uniref:mite allergen Der f 7-like n=1 Tax=Aethina tumida TaxID=116153 RepID=UPI0021489617|nr:mite allergen Der f 7-like [Aethina tumida]